VNQGGVPQWLGWTSASTILAVYDTRAVLYNAGGGERAVYDFAGTELKDVSVDAAGNVALLLASGQVSQAVTLDKNLNVQFSRCYLGGKFHCPGGEPVLSAGR